MSTESIPASASTMWFRVLVDDSGVADPDGFRTLLNLVRKHVPASAVAVAHFDGVWNSEAAAHKMEKRVQIFSFDEFEGELEKLSQIVWGRFFLLHDAAAIMPRETQKPDTREMEQRIALSAATLCVADNSYYFVFTTSPSLVGELLDQAWPVEVIKNTLSNILKMPEEF